MNIKSRQNIQGGVKAFYDIVEKSLQSHWFSHLLVTGKPSRNILVTLSRTLRLVLIVKRQQSGCTCMCHWFFDKTSMWWKFAVCLMFSLKDVKWMYMCTYFNPYSKNASKCCHFFRGSSLLGWWIPQKNSATFTWTSSQRSLLPLLWRQRRLDSYDTEKNEKLKTT